MPIEMPCPDCALKPGETNHPTGMIFVGWGHGWQPCIACGGKGTRRVPGPGQIMAPFTSEQVQALNAWQRLGHVHPFTCVNRGDGRHAGDGELVATTQGWICTFCDYTQDWAHEGMARTTAPEVEEPASED